MRTIYDSNSSKTSTSKAPSPAIATKSIVSGRPAARHASENGKTNGRLESREFIFHRLRLKLILVRAEDDPKFASEDWLEQCLLVMASEVPEIRFPGQEI